MIEAIWLCAAHQDVEEVRLPYDTLSESIANRIMEDNAYISARTLTQESLPDPEVTA